MYAFKKTILHIYESCGIGENVSFARQEYIIFDPSFNLYRVVGEAVGNAFQDELKLK